MYYLIIYIYIYIIFIINNKIIQLHTINYMDYIFNICNCLG